MWHFPSFLFVEKPLFLHYSFRGIDTKPLKMIRVVSIVKTHFPITLFLVVLISFSSAFSPVSAQGAGVVPASGKPFVVVMDPGHGGIDPGAHGRYSTEKQIALGVGLKAG